MDALAAELVDLIRGSGLLTVDSMFTPDSDLFANGLDSMSMMHLLLAVEERWGVTVPDSALCRDTFSSPRALARVLAPLVDPARLAA